MGRKEYIEYFNKKIQDWRKVFYKAPIEDISQSVGIGAYKKYGVYMLLHSLYGDNFLEMEEDKIGKLAADIIGTIFKNLKGDESESLPRYYGNEPLRVSKTRKRFVKGL